MILVYCCLQSQLTHGGQNGQSDGGEGGEAFSMHDPDLLPRGHQQHGGRPLQPRSQQCLQRQGTSHKDKEIS